MGEAPAVKSVTLCYTRLLSLPPTVIFTLMAVSVQRLAMMRAFERVSMFCSANIGETDFGFLV